MNKLFGLFLLALAFLTPGTADAAARFAVCTTTCTWDNTSTAMWSTSSGGATGASAPVAGDDVTINGATCVGGTTCTITTFAGTISVQSITWGACTASTAGCIIDASVNNTNFTVSGTSGSPFNGAGTGTRKWLSGTGTYTLTNTNVNAVFDFSTTTNDTGSVFSGATWILGSAAANTSPFPALSITGSSSFGPTTISTSATGKATVQITGGTPTFASLVLAGPLTLSTGNFTVTGAISSTGTAASTPSIIQSNALGSVRTLTIGAASTMSWTGFREITIAGAGGLAVSNCLDFGRNTISGGNSCTAPSVGGGGGGRIIGG